MQEDGGFIKLYRSLLDWEWYDDPNTLRVFLHILLNANWKETKWHGETIKAGEYRTTVAELSKGLKLSNQQTKTTLEHLKSTNDITIKTSPKGSIISIQNWSKYQLSNKQNSHQSTNHQGKNQQTINKRPANPFHYREEIKNSKNKEERENGFAAAPSLDEVKEFFVEKAFKASPEAFYYYYDSTGWKRRGQSVTNWRSLAETWERRESEKPNKKQETKPEEKTHSSFDVDELEGLGLL